MILLEIYNFKVKLIRIVQTVMTNNVQCEYICVVIKFIELDRTNHNFNSIIFHLNDSNFKKIKFFLIEHVEIKVVSIV